MSDDDEDDYYERMQEALLPDFEEEPECRQFPKENKDENEMVDEDSYYARHASDSALFADEDNLIWQSLLRQELQGFSDDVLISNATTLTDLLMLKQYLFSYLPTSLHVFESIRRYIFNQCSDVDYGEFATDSIAHPSFVMHIRNIQELPASVIVVKKGDRKAIKCEVSLYAAHELPENLVREIARYLYRRGCRDVMFTGCEATLANRLREVLESAANFACSYSSNCVMVTLQSSSTSTLTFLRRHRDCLPKGYSYVAIDAEDALLINDTWAYKGDSSLTMLRNMITSNPCVGIAFEGTLVSWILTYFGAAMGVLYTLEAHRGKGLARCAVSRLALLHLENANSLEHPPYAFITEANVASRALFVSLGFESFSTFVWLGLKAY